MDHARTVSVLGTPPLSSCPPFQSLSFLRRISAATLGTAAVSSSLCDVLTCRLTRHPSPYYSRWTAGKRAVHDLVSCYWFRSIRSGLVQATLNIMRDLRKLHEIPNACVPVSVDTHSALDVRDSSSRWKSLFAFCEGLSSAPVRLSRKSRRAVATSFPLRRSAERGSFCSRLERSTLTLPTRQLLVRPRLTFVCGVGISLVETRPRSTEAFRLTAALCATRGIELSIRNRRTGTRGELVSLLLQSMPPVQIALQLSAAPMLCTMVSS